MHFSRKLQILLLILVPLLLYAPTIRFPFIWDDEAQIVNNEVLRDPSRWLHIVSSSTFDSGGGQLIGAFYRPLVSLSYLFNYQLWGLNPTGFRIFQILLHIATGLLIFFIMKKILSRQINNGSARALSFITTLVFLIHPTHVESVVYIGSIGEILYTFFALVGFALFIFPLGSEINIKVPFKKLLLFFFFVFLSLFAKETAVVIIPIAALYLLLFVKPRWHTWITYTAGSILTIGLYCWVRFGFAQVPILRTYSSNISEASFGERLLTLPYIVFRYLVTLVAPYRLLIYQNEVVHSIVDIRFWGSILALILIVSLLIRFLKPRVSKLEYFFLGWFIIGIAPVLNLVGLDMTIAERWLYFPSIGFLFFFALILQRCIKKIPSFTRILSYALVLVLVLFSLRTLVRAQDWRSEDALYGHDIRFVKDSYELMNSRSVTLIGNHQYDEAQALLERALILNRNYFQTYINLGSVYQLQGKTEKAIDIYLESIQRFNINFGYTNLATLLINEKRYDEARDVLTLGVQLFPTFKRLTFLEIVLEFKTGNKEVALARMQELLKQGALDRDIQEFMVTLGQFQIPRDALIQPRE